MDRRGQGAREVVEGNAYFLEPGHLFVSVEPATVLTVLGSCIAVCLWDTVRGFGGINHFVQPFTTDRTRATPVYGNVATVALVRMLQKEGCRSEDLIAQIIGGGNPSGGAETLWEKKLHVARAVLQREGIRIVSEDVGGTQGRKILFNTGTGHVAVMKVHRIRETDWK